MVRTLFNGGPQYQSIGNTIVQLIRFLRFVLMEKALGQRIGFPPDLLALVNSDIKENRQVRFLARESPGVSKL